MGKSLSKSKNKDGAEQKPGAQKRSTSADGEKRPTFTSTEKVRKQKILESAPHKVYDAKSPGNTKIETDIRTAAKKAALDDTTPLYKPKLKQRPEIALPIQDLQERFGMVVKSKSKDQVKIEGKDKGGSGSGGFDFPKDQKQSSEKQGPPQRKSVVLSSPQLKNLMADKKATEEKAAKLAKDQADQKLREDEAARQRSQRKKDGVDKLASDAEHQKISFAPVAMSLAPLMGHFGVHPTKDKPSIGRPVEKMIGLQAIRALIGKETSSGTSTFLKILRHKVHEGGDLNRIKQFGIPDQRQLLTVALPKDTWRYDFGGNLRHYYSSLLRNYIPNNMLERYRGVSPSSPCLTSIDLSSLGQKASIEEQEKQKRKAIRDKHIEALHEASLDENHFEFLKQLANNQPVSVPLTIIHDMARELAPMINQTQSFYNRNLGPNHECTQQATESFFSIWNRVMMYNGM